MKTTLKNVSVVIPAYNEEALIKTAVVSIGSGIRPFVSQYELIVIDDGSTDATLDIVRRCADEDQRIKVIYHGSNIGKGAALIDGFKQAKMEWILFSDADMQIDISHIGEFLSYADEYDVMIGYRTIRSDSLVRRMMSKVYGRAASALLGLRVRDAHCPFKLFRRDVINGITLNSQGFIIDTELLCRIRNAGYSVKELPVTSRARAQGSSALSFRHVGMILREFIALVRDRRLRRARW